MVKRLAVALVLAAGCAAARPPGQVLYVAGAMPRVGTDKQIHDLLEARHLHVVDVRENATPEQARGKRLVVMSYSMQSTEFAAEAFADLPVPIIVLEHEVLPRLGMTAASGHGYQFGGVLTTDAGDLGVYTARGKEMFWGVPGPAALRLAHVQGNPERWVYFGYAAGAPMVGRPAPARRMLFFAASHAPPPVADEILNAQGLAMLADAIDWSLQ
jgi:hypothetical protein